MNLDDKQNDGTDKEGEMVEEEEIVAKSNQEGNKMINNGGGQRFFIRVE
jgi:hypothetical protein